MCDHLVLIHKGRIAADTTVAELEGAHGDLESAFEILTGGADETVTVGEEVSGG